MEREGCTEGYRNVRGFLSLQLSSIRLVCKKVTCDWGKNSLQEQRELSLRLIQSQEHCKAPPARVESPAASGRVFRKRLLRLSLD